jgi:hypothetical protein
VREELQLLAQKIHLGFQDYVNFITEEDIGSTEDANNFMEDADQRSIRIAYDKKVHLQILT